MPPPVRFCLHLQVYSLELVEVMSQACKTQLDVIHAALDPDEPQTHGLESHAQQQRMPRTAEPYQLVRALFVLLQNPLNGQLPLLQYTCAQSCCCLRQAPCFVLFLSCFNDLSKSTSSSWICTRDPMVSSHLVAWKTWLWLEACCADHVTHMELTWQH